MVPTGAENHDRLDGPALLRWVVDDHAAALQLYAGQWCSAPEDVVQDALVRLMRQRRKPDNVVGWLYRVVRNGAISAARAETRRHRYETASAKGRQAWFVPSNSQKLDAEAAAEALRQLPIEQREIIVAHLWGRLTFEAIAELVGSSSSTAHRRYLAGLDALRERLDKP